MLASGLPLFHLPSGQINRSLDGMTTTLEGKTFNSMSTYVAVLEVLPG